MNRRRFLKKIKSTFRRAIATSGLIYSAPAFSFFNVLMMKGRIKPAFINANTGTSSASASSLTWSHTTTSKTSCLVVGGFAGDNGTTVTITGVTFNGVSMTQVEKSNSSAQGMSGLWVMFNPPVGTYNIVLTCGSLASRGVSGVSANFAGVNAVNVSGVTHYTTADTCTTTISSTTSGIAIGNFFVSTAGGTTSFDSVSTPTNFVAAATKNYLSNSNNKYHALWYSTDIKPAGSYTMTLNAAGSAGLHQEFAILSAQIMPAVTFTDFSTNGSALTTYSFASMSLGTAAADRYIVVAVAARHPTTRTINSVTIAGVSATMLVELNGVGEQSCGLYIASVPTGTTGTIAFTLSGAASRAGIGVWAVTGLNSATPTDSGTSTNTTTTSASVNVSAGGVIIAANYGVGSSSSTWTGVTEDFDTGLTGPNSFAGGSTRSATAQTVAVACTQASDTSTAHVVVALR